MKPTVRDLIKACPALRKVLNRDRLGETIIGVGGITVPLMEATVEDLRAYREVIDARNRRRQRRQMCR